MGLCQHLQHFGGLFDRNNDVAILRLLGYGIPDAGKSAGGQTIYATGLHILREFPVKLLQDRPGPWATRKWMSCRKIFRAVVEPCQRCHLEDCAGCFGGIARSSAVVVSLELVTAPTVESDSGREDLSGGALGGRSISTRW
jgi:hypothetical protein